jgi:hypothetical protein
LERRGPLGFARALPDGHLAVCGEDVVVHAGHRGGAV